MIKHLSPRTEDEVENCLKNISLKDLILNLETYKNKNNVFYNELRKRLQVESITKLDIIWETPPTKWYPGINMAYNMEVMINQPYYIFENIISSIFIDNNIKYITSYPKIQDTKETKETEVIINFSFND